MRVRRKGPCRAVCFQGIEENVNQARWTERPTAAIAWPRSCSICSGRGWVSAPFERRQNPVHRGLRQFHFRERSASRYPDSVALIVPEFPVSCGVHERRRVSLRFLSPFHIVVQYGSNSVAFLERGLRRDPGDRRRGQASAVGHPPCRSCRWRPGHSSRRASERNTRPREQHLKLNSRRGLGDIVVIDQVEKVPAANSRRCARPNHRFAVEDGWETTSWAAECGLSATWAQDAGSARLGTPCAAWPIF